MNKQLFEVVIKFLCVSSLIFVTACSDSDPVSSSSNNGKENSMLENSIVNKEATTPTQANPFAAGAKDQDAVGASPDKNTSGNLNERANTVDGPVAETKDIENDPAELAVDKKNTFQPVESFVVSGDSSYLTWSPANNDQSTLNASTKLHLAGPNGLNFSKKFSPGEPMQMTEQLPDGLYNWEAVTQPEIAPEVREQMAAIRQSGDINAERAFIKEYRAKGYLPTQQQTRNNSQTSSFRIKDGKMVDSGLVEKR